MIDVDSKKIQGLLLINNQIKNFSNLRKELKLEIYDFLPTRDMVGNVSELNKINLKYLKEHKNMIFIRRNFEFFYQLVNFACHHIEKISSELDVENEKLLDIYLYFLLKKFKDEKILEVKSNCNGLIIRNFLKEKTKLQKIIFDVEFFNVDKNSIINLATCLSKNQSVIEVQIMISKKISEINEDIKFFFNLFEINNLIIKFDLSNVNFGKYSNLIYYITKSLLFNTSLKNINLSNTQLGLTRENAIYLSELIYQNSSIEKLNLSLNQFGICEEIFSLISEALIINKSIKKLNLNENSIGKNGKNMLMLGKIIRKNTTIEKLDISSNFIGLVDDNSIQYFFDSFYSQEKDTHNKIKNLDMSYNIIGKKNNAVACLNNFLLETKNLKNINLANNYIGEIKGSFKFICSAIEKNKFLKKINFSENILKIENDNINIIENLLLNNESIKKFNIKGNALRIFSLDNNVNKKLKNDDFFI